MLFLALLAPVWARFPEGWMPVEGIDLPEVVVVRDLPTTAMAWTPDARGMLVTEGGRAAVVSATGQDLASLPCTTGVAVVDGDLSADGARGVVVDSDGRACVAGVGSANALVLRGSATHAAMLAGVAVVSDARGALTAYDAEGRRSWRRAAPVGAVAQLRRAPRATARDEGDPLRIGRELLVAGERGVALIDAAHGRLVRAAFVGDVASAMMDAARLYVGLRDGVVIVLDRETWREVARLPRRDPVVDLDLRSGRLLLTRHRGPGGDSVRVWDLVRDVEVFAQVVGAPAAAPARARFAPQDTERIVAGTPGGSRLWREPDLGALPRPVPLAEPPRHRALRAEAGAMMGLRELRPEELPEAAVSPGEPVLPRQGAFMAARPLAFVGDGVLARAADGSEDPGEVGLLTKGGAVGQRLAGWAAGPLAVDAARVLACAAPSCTAVGSWRDGVAEARIPVAGPLRAVDVDGRWIGVVERDGTVRAGAGSLRAVDVAAASSVAVSAARGRVAVGGDDGSVRVLGDAAGGVRATAVFEGPVRAMAWSDDGTVLAASGRRHGSGASSDARARTGAVAFLAAPGATADAVPAAFATEEPAEDVALREGRILARSVGGLEVRDLQGELRLAWASPAVDARIVDASTIEVLTAEGTRRTMTLSASPLPWTPPAVAPSRSVDGAWAVTVEGDLASSWRALTGRRVLALPPLGAGIRAVSFAPTGDLVAFVRADGVVDVADVRSGELGRPLEGPPSGSLPFARFSEDGGALWTLDGRGAVVGWRVSDGASVAEVPLGSPVRRVHDAGRLLGFELDDGRAIWVDSAPGAATRVLAGARTLAVGGPEDQLLHVDGDGVRLEHGPSAATRGHRFAPPAPGLRPEAGAIAPDGRHVALAWSDGRIRVHALPFGELRATLESDTSQVASKVEALAFSEDGGDVVVRSVPVGGGAPSVRRFLWAVDQERSVTPLGPGAVTRTAMATRVLARGGRAWTAHTDGVIRVWDLRSGAQIAVLTGHVGAVRDLAWDDAGALLSVGDDGVLRVWDAGTGVGRLALWSQRCAPSSEAALRCGPADGFTEVWAEGDTAFARGQDGLVRAWRLKDGAPLGRGRLPHAAMRTHTGAVVAEDGGTRMIAGEDGRLRLVDLASGATRAVITPLSDGGWLVDRADGARLASPSLRDGTDVPLYTR